MGRARPSWALFAAAVAATALVAGALAFLAIRRVADRQPPSFRQLTFRRGTIVSARFAPDGQTVVYSAAWDGKPMEVFVGRPESPESRPFGLVGADILAISRSGDMAVSLDRRQQGAFRRTGTLAQLSVAGGAAPREILKDVDSADWSPDGKSLAIVRAVPGRMRLEYPAGKVLYETSGWVSHPRVSPDGQAVAFIDHPTPGDDGGSVAEVDLAGAVKKLSEPFASAQGLAWFPGGEEVWFTAAKIGGNRALYSTTRSGRVRARIQVPGSLTLQDFSSDGRILATSDTTRMEMYALAPGEAKERELTWLDWSLPTALSADGRHVVFSETGEGGGAGYSVYIRKTDGSPAVRLGEGSGRDLSPDGQWVLTLVHPNADPELVAYPTGAGEPKKFPKDGLSIHNGWFMPDGKRILFSASEPGRGPRLYIRDVEGGKPRAVTPEGYGNLFGIAPDGSWAVANGPDRKRYLYPLSGGDPKEIPGLDRDDVIDQVSADGRSLVVHRRGVPARVQRLDLATGRQDPWRTLMPPDASGVVSVNVLPTPDGEAYVYAYSRALSDLFLLEGVK
jgi:Tol biopolymer transport system component